MLELLSGHDVRPFVRTAPGHPASPRSRPRAHRSAARTSARVISVSAWSRCQSVFATSAIASSSRRRPRRARPAARGWRRARRASRTRRQVVASTAAPPRRSARTPVEATLGVDGAGEHHDGPGAAPSRRCRAATDSPREAELGLRGVVGEQRDERLVVAEAVSIVIPSSARIELLSPAARARSPTRRASPAARPAAAGRTPPPAGCRAGRSRICSHARSRRATGMGPRRPTTPASTARRRDLPRRRPGGVLDGGLPGRLRVARPASSQCTSARRRHSRSRPRSSSAAVKVATRSGKRRRTSWAAGPISKRRRAKSRPTSAWAS